MAIEFITGNKNKFDEVCSVLGVPLEQSDIEGILTGEIVAARGDKDFGWGPIFQPEGNKKTFGEMERDEKHAISMRGIAARKLKDFLQSPQH